MTEKEKIAWAAGFFDGEGCILITNNSKGPGKARGKALRIVVAQIDRRPLEFLQDIFGGVICQNRQRGGKILWQWYVSSVTAASALRDMEPMLIGKRDEAQLALEFQDRRNPSGIHRTADQKQWDEWAREEMSRLKRAA